MPLNADATDVAKYIAARLIALRDARGLKQKDVAPVLGVKIAQLSKYETAESLIPIDRLMRAAEFFGVPVDGLLPIITPRPLRGMADEAATFHHDGVEPQTTRILSESNELATAFVSIQSPDVRASVAAHVKALAKAKV